MEKISFRWPASIEVEFQIIRLESGKQQARILGIADLVFLYTNTGSAGTGPNGNLNMSVCGRKWSRNRDPLKNGDVVHAVITFDRKGRGNLDLKDPFFYSWFYFINVLLRGNDWVVIGMRWCKIVGKLFSHVYCQVDKSTISSSLWGIFSRIRSTVDWWRIGLWGCRAKVSGERCRGSRQRRSEPATEGGSISRMCWGAGRRSVAGGLSCGFGWILSAVGGWIQKAPARGVWIYIVWIVLQLFLFQGFELFWRCFFLMLCRLEVLGESFSRKCSDPCWFRAGGSWGPHLSGGPWREPSASLIPEKRRNNTWRRSVGQLRRVFRHPVGKNIGNNSGAMVNFRKTALGSWDILKMGAAEKDSWLRLLSQCHEVVNSLWCSLETRQNHWYQLT